MFFSKVKDKRRSNACHKLSDILMSGFAMFSLKGKSLLSFTELTSVEKNNLKTVYGIDSVCSDSNLREVLDGIDPQFLRELFPKKFETLRNTGILAEYSYKIGGVAYHIVSCDGVQHFSSKLVSCDCCLRKEHKNGSTTYHHNMLCSVLVHPDKREVFILDVEPIQKQDGSKKNDCEQNAAKRLQENMSNCYGKYQKYYNFLFVEDALYANAPHIAILENKLVAIMKAGRARWKIENETFNTLKNLGYHFERNYGHGKDHLSTMFAYLMMLAFYIDQLVQACCHNFQQLEKNIKTKVKLWDTIAAIFKVYTVNSFLIFLPVAIICCNFLMSSFIKFIYLFISFIMDNLFE